MHKNGRRPRHAQEGANVKKNSIVSKSKRRKLVPYLFIAPHVIIFLIFFAIPFFYGVYASFTKWNLFNDPVWVGLDNYKTILFNKDSTFYRQFWHGLKNTVGFVLMCVPFQILLPLTLALFINQRPRGARVFQSIFYMPTLFSITSVILCWLFIFSRSQGLWNKLFGTDLNWLGEQPFVWIAITITTLWWVIGANMIIYIAALAGVDASQTEAAQIDGANFLQRFWYVTLPSIKFPLTYTLVTSIIAQFNIYGQPLMLNATLTPAESVYVLLMYIRNLAFGTGNPIAGTASAMATCLGLIIGVVSLVQLRMMREQS